MLLSLRGEVSSFENDDSVVLFSRCTFDEKYVLIVAETSSGVAGAYCHDSDGRTKYTIPSISIGAPKKNKGNQKPSETFLIDMFYDVENFKVVICNPASARLTVCDLFAESQMNIEFGHLNSGPRKLREVTWLACANELPQVAAGTDSGILIHFDLEKMEICTPMQIMTKSSSEIVLGCWDDKDEIIALVTESSTLLVRDLVLNDTVASIMLKEIPISIEFVEFKGDISILLGFKEAIRIIPVREPSRASMITFPPEFGHLVGLGYIPGGLIVCCFAKGRLAVLSAAMNGGEVVGTSDSFSTGSEATEPVFDFQKSELCAVIAIGTQVSLVDFSAWSEGVSSQSTGSRIAEGFKIDVGETWSRSNDKIISVSWGQARSMATAVTDGGRVLCMSAKVDRRVCSCKESFAVYDRKTGVRVFDFSDINSNRDPKLTISVYFEAKTLFMDSTRVGLVPSEEPSKIIIMNSQSNKQVGEFKMADPIENAVIVGDRLLLLANGKIRLFDMINTENENTGDENLRILSAVFNGRLIGYASVQGTLHIIDGAKFVEIHRHTHSRPIELIKSNRGFTRFCFVDSDGYCFLLSISHGTLLPLAIDGENGCPIGKIDDIFFNSDDIITLCSSSQCRTFRYTPLGMQPEHMEEIDSLSLPLGSTIIAISSGQVVFIDSEGNIEVTPLPIFETMVPVADEALSDDDVDFLKERLSANLLMHNFDDALVDSTLIDEEESWEKLLDIALEQLQVDIIIECYRKLGKPSMVSYYEEVLEVEEVNILKSRILLARRKYDEAQEACLNSSRPMLALEMRRDLCHQEEAIRLAEMLDISSIPLISMEYARIFETKGQYDKALEQYEKGIIEGGDPSHNRECRKGIARMCIHTGNYIRAKKIAEKVNSESLFMGCAEILEEQGLLEESSEMFVKANKEEDAVRLLLKAKKFDLATSHIGNVTSKSLLSEYAKRMEELERWPEAIEAYERADDVDRVIALSLSVLHDEGKSFRLVWKHRNPVGAQLCADHCLRRANVKEAIPFLVIAGNISVAFRLARESNMMEIYGRALEGKGTREEYLRVAKYFKDSGDYVNAGFYTAKAGEHYDAVQLYLLCGEESLDDLIEVVGKAKSEIITRQVTDFISGRTDAIPKSPKYAYKLNIALKEYGKAAEIAAAMARGEMDEGEYESAHDMLFEVHQELVSHGISVTTTIQSLLFLIHSYALVRDLVSDNDHLGAAHMLLRALASINQFKKHTVEIMLSAMIECGKVGMKRSSFEIALELIKPEHKSSLSDSYKKKVEAIVRRQNKSQIQEVLTPCPFCNTPLSEYKVSCANCKNLVPYCVVSGKHMVKDDNSLCPNCGFTALYSRLSRLAVESKPCPMCHELVMSASLKKISPV